MTHRTCTINGCESKFLARGFCNKHYKRWQIYGDALAPKPAPSRRNLRERFDECYLPGPADDCWEWNGTISVYGYGVIAERINGVFTQYKAHRLSYEYNHGPIPDGLLICHTCDNRKCVNPQHLYSGTEADNARDKAVRNRVKGERHPQAKLTARQAREIADIYASGQHSQSEVGRMFGIPQTLVSQIVLGRSGYCQNTDFANTGTMHPGVPDEQGTQHIPA